MSTWFTRLAGRLGALQDPTRGPWNPMPSDWADVDADVRRLRRDLDAVRVRFSDHR
ncbi:MAG TPA: hypothetical protein PKM33_10075 [Mycobacterium sp.]|nr:hypothetical protein [Mycobacterium sp.]MCB0943508.1 hypothetical protein [Mycobacterium sp.]HNF07628.1 hypothetical protein [Mycobacterium sp.]HNP13592.1 hypothetical protein [Mycobacterium sp.]